jgi:hypothetical protein
MQMPQMAKDVIIKGVIALRPSAVKPQFQGAGPISASVSL